MTAHPKEKITIIGGGIIAALIAYFNIVENEKSGRQIRITIYEKNTSFLETTTSNIVPSLTPDEILSVVPRGQELILNLQSLFNEPGGIRVDDVPGLNESNMAAEFIKAVTAYGKDLGAYEYATKLLLEMGRKSMDLWQAIYDGADEELRAIFDESNFNPCREPTKKRRELHDGYRIDLIYSIPGVKSKAEAMIKNYQSLGYSSCKLLTPSEVIELDSHLRYFCEQHSRKSLSGEQVWDDDAIAVWRPGGCLNTQVFLPKFYEYLRRRAGTYVNENRETKDCFRLKFNREVNHVHYREMNQIYGLGFFGRASKYSKARYQFSEYIFCPGEAVGALHKFGFSEPVYTNFAGPSLLLNIALPPEKVASYSNLNHCMEVHQEGVVLAWQARVKNGIAFLGVGGTKAFYGDKKPTVNDAFAKDRNLLQLNMLNDVFPDLLSIALGRETDGQKLTKADLKTLENIKIAKRWVGTRAVAYDGFPTVGHVHNGNGKVLNGFCSTHWGSGGVSFAAIAGLLCWNSQHANSKDNAFEQAILRTGSSARLPFKASY